MRRPLPAYAASRRSRVAGRRRRRGLRREPLPGVQGARLLDALDHRARHVAPRGAADRDPGQPGHAARSRASAASASHIGQAFLAEEIVGVELRRELVQRRPQRRLRQDARGDRGGRRRLSRALQRRADLPAASASTRCWPAPPSRSWCASSARTWTTLRRQASRVRGRSSDIDGPGRPAHRAHGRRSRRSTSTENLAAGAALWAQAGRRPPGGRGADVQRGGGRHLPGRAGLRRARLEHARDTRNSLTDIRNLPIDTPSGGHVRLGDVANVRVRPTPNVIQREDASRRIDVARRRRRDRSLSEVVGDVRDRLAALDIPAGYHAELLGEAVETRAPSNRLLLFGLAAAIGIFLLLQAAFGSLRAGADVLPDPADGARGRRAGGRPAPAARSRSARSSGSWPCSGSPRATGSC